MTAPSIFEEPSLEAPISFVMSSQEDGPEDEPSEDTDEDTDDEDGEEEEMDDNDELMNVTDEEE